MAAAARATVPDESVFKLRPPSRLRLIDGVAESLEDAILSGRMHPGERLIETKLCDDLKVSRTTLREALLMLERRGLVRSEPRRGTFVTRLSHEDSKDLCVTRAILEAFAVCTGFERLNEATFAKMDAIIAEMASLELPEQLPRLIKMDLAFHHLLLQVCDSPRIRELWSSLDGQMSALILSSIEHYHAGSDDFADFHRALLHAVSSGDRDVARDGVILHYVGREAGVGDTLAEMADVINAMAHYTAGVPAAT